MGLYLVWHIINGKIYIIIINRRDPWGTPALMKLVPEHVKQFQKYVLQVII